MSCLKRKISSRFVFFFLECSKKNSKNEGDEIDPLFLFK